MNKNLLLLEINECDFKFFEYGSKKYGYPNIKKFFLSKNTLDTYTNDNKEGYNLDPWVQWVSVHTGKLSKNHKIYRLGEKINKNTDQIWDKLSKKKIKSSIWGAFNSSLRLRKSINFFFPDPWSFKEEAYPNNLNTFLKLPRYYAQNYPNINKFKIIYLGIIFLVKIFLSKNFFYLFKNIFQLFKIFLISSLRSFNLYFFFDLMSLLVINNTLKTNRSDFTLIALNSFAHYQHNYWNDKKFEKIYFWYLNEMIKIIEQISKSYNSSLILNGFSQKKIKNEYYLRPKKPKKFFESLNLNFLNIEPNMTTGAIVYFNSFKDKTEAINKLKNIKIYDYSLFDIQDFKNSKKIFYNFSLISKINKYHSKYLEKKNYKIFFRKPLNTSKNYNYSKKDKLIIDSILKNVIFMKSTSRHISKGKLFYNNFNFIKKDIIKNKIHNIKIFNNILEHFK
tara:strand:+ start:4560 stop:5906 length:1347 start_codon:yes stop_codon:yes gene_type:complete